jgi:hypothetical protein
VTQAGSVPFGKDVPLPALGLVGVLRHAQPDGGVGEGALRLGTVGEEVHLAVPIHIALEQAVDAVDLVVDDAELPAILQGIPGTFQPGHPAGLVVRTDVIEVTVAIDVEGLRVDEVLAGGVGKENLLPLRGDEQPRLPAGAGDHVGKAVAGEVAPDGGVGVAAGKDDVLLPLAACGQGEEGEQEEGDSVGEHGVSFRVGTDAGVIVRRLSHRRRRKQSGAIAGRQFPAGRSSRVAIERNET